MTDFYDLQAYHEAEQREQQRTNATRAGRSAHVITTVNAGQEIQTKPLMFEVPFLSEPFMSTASTLVTPPDPRYWRWPVGFVGAYRWHRNAKGHYLGVYLYFDVRVPAADDDIGDDAGVSVVLARLQLDELKKRLGVETPNVVETRYRIELAESRLRGPGKVVMAHHLCFQAMAYQDMGSVILNQAYQSQPRHVGM